MPPLVHNRWPAPIREAFAGMNRQLEQGDTAGVSTECERVVRLLADLGASDATEPTRRQIAYSYFDLTYYFQKLGRDQQAKWGYEQARDHWSMVRPDFEARSQSAGCHNHLGLIALNAGDLPRAEAAFRAAVADREAASRTEAHPADQAENVVYLAGVMCNLGTLYRQRGDRAGSARVYDQAIESLTGSLPAGDESLDEEVRNLHMDMWRQIYGTPHWLRTARQFLANARNGKAALEQGQQAEPASIGD